MTKAQEFAKKYDMAATDEDVARIKGQLRAFYADVETIDRPTDHFVQLYHGEAIRRAIGKRGDLYGAQGVVMAIADMPDAWLPQYKASVAYHLGPIMDEVINS